MDLMDWKAVETNSENSIKDAEVTIVISRTLLARALKEIKKLGGLSNEQEAEQAEKEAKKNTVSGVV